MTRPDSDLYLKFLKIFIVEFYSTRHIYNSLSKETHVPSKPNLEFLIFQTLEKAETFSQEKLIRKLTYSFFTVPKARFKFKISLQTNHSDLV